VLHGLLAPLDGVDRTELPLDDLVRRVRDRGVREVVVATPLSVEGEATALYLAQVLRPLGVRVSRIAGGTPGTAASSEIRRIRSPSGARSKAAAISRVVGRAAV
jgi:recombinational DNA repair protein RecR